MLFSVTIEYMFDKLPDDIIRKIYEYDDTYRQKYNLVMKKLMVVFDSYNRYILHQLFQNDLYFNINLQINNVFHFIRISNIRTIEEMKAQI